jgi:hypothetical protein
MDQLRMCFRAWLIAVPSVHGVDAGKHQEGGGRDALHLWREERRRRGLLLGREACGRTPRCDPPSWG